MKKKTNVVPIHTKNDKQCIKKYRPLSLLPICSKIFEKSFLTNCTSFLMKMTYYHLTNQAFDPVKYITHKIYQSFDNDLEVRRVFLDISKAFDKVWHERLILKLSLNGMSGNLLNLLKDFLKYRKQSVLLDGQNSSWKGIISGDPLRKVYVVPLRISAKISLILWYSIKSLYRICCSSLSSSNRSVP